MIRHPREALFSDASTLPILSSCDHYAGNQRLAEKSLALQNELGGSFDITLDLEDGAAVGQEEVLLDSFIQIVRGPENRFKKIGIRIHDFFSPHWRGQVQKIVERVGDVVAHITIPKTRLPEELAVMIDHLQKQCERVGQRRKIPVHVLIESPLALGAVNTIAALPWVRCLEFGLMDFVSSHHGVIPSVCMRSPGQFEHALIRRAKTEIVAAAVANDCVAAHNVSVGYSDIAQTRADAERARREFGFMRMWSIHPAQVRPILEAMSPATEALTLGGRILAAAAEKDWAPVTVDGTLHDRASYRYYWELLQRAHANGSLPPELAQRYF